MKIVRQLSLLLVLVGIIPLTATSCIDPSMLKSKKTAETESEEGGGPPVAVDENPAPGGGGVLEMDNTKIVDRKKAMAENPGWVVTENRINAMDPVSAAAQAYYAIPARAQMLNMKHQIDIIKADTGRQPTFEEFSKLLGENQVKLKGIYRWQVYAYDDENGDIVILENRDMKRAEYEKAGLKLDE